MENPEIPGRIQVERLIPVEIFRKKSNTFPGITVLPFLPKPPKFSVPFVWITSARLHVERKRKIYRYFVNRTTQSRSCFRCQKKNSTIWRNLFTGISVQTLSTQGKSSIPTGMVWDTNMAAVLLFQDTSMTDVIGYFNPYFYRLF